VAGLSACLLWPSQAAVRRLRTAFALSSGGAREPPRKA